MEEKSPSTLPFKYLPNIYYMLSTVLGGRNRRNIPIETRSFFPLSSLNSNKIDMKTANHNTGHFWRRMGWEERKRLRKGGLCPKDGGGQGSGQQWRHVCVREFSELGVQGAEGKGQV